VTFKKAFVFMALALGLTAPQLLRADDLVYGTLASVSATGQRSLSAEQVLAVVRSKPGDALLAAVVNEDVKALWRMGIFSDVQALVARLPGGDPMDPKIALTFVLSERPVVSDLRFFGNKEESDGELKDKASIKEGDVYEPSKVADAVDKILSLYHEKNYYAAEVRSELKQAQEPGKVILNLYVSEGLSMKVASIKVTGNKVFSESKIKGEMEDTSEVGWFGIGGSYDRAKLQDDLRKVLMAYYREGYVKAKLEGYSLEQLGDHAREVAEKVTEFNEAAKEIRISFRVEEGIQYKVASINSAGNTVVSSAKLMEEAETKPGDVFDRERWEKDLQKLKTEYQNRGYIYANPAPKYAYDDAAGKVAISLNWTEGGIAYIESIKIRGNDVTKDKVIRRELLVKEGEPFDTAKVMKSRERVMNLGFFENVVPDYEPGSEMDKLVLVFDVAPERKTGTLSLGAGYSSAEGLVGYLQVSQNNLFGNGQAVSAMWQVGSSNNSYSLSFTEPWLLDTPTTAGVDVFQTDSLSTYNNQGYDLASTGGALRLGRTLSPNWKVLTTYRYSSDNYSNITSALQPYIAAGITNTSSIMPSISFDTRDNIFDATRGVYENLSVQLAGGPLGADRNFVKPVFDSSAFFSTPPVFGMSYLKKFVLGLHVKMGAGWGYDAGRGYTDLAPADKFYMGGTDSVRGYVDHSIGPKGSTSTTEVVGGDLAAQFNAEYGFHPFDPLKLHVFFDAGNAWTRPGIGNSSDEVRLDKSFELVPSVGVGFLFTIPTSVIQIRLDWGYGLDHSQPGFQNGGKVHFNIGNIF